MQIITCGAAGSGKSTLINGLFDNARRKYSVTDTPGGDDYTLDMAIAAAKADVAVVVVDGGKGLDTQARRDAYIAHLLGVPNIVLAVNKMDQVDYAQAKFGAIEQEFSEFAKEIGAGPVTSIPVSAQDGANTSEKAQQTGWYTGPSLLEYIEVTEAKSAPLTQKRLEVADQFETHIIWIGEEPMLPGRPYQITLGDGTATAKLAQPKYEVNVDTLEQAAAKTLELGQIGVCNISLDEQLPFTAHTEDRERGRFTITDTLSGETVGLGLINFALRRASNIHWQALDINKGTRASTKSQQPTVLWFTGLSGSGKSTVANIVEKQLTAMGHHTYLLDGDNVRHGLNRDLGFTDADRVENIRRVSEVSKLMADAGLIVLVSFISPFRAERRMARDMMDDGEFIEVYVETPLEVCEARDIKGLYAKARAGQIKNFTGIDSDYEVPETAEITINTAEKSAEETAEEIIAHLEDKGRLKS